ncbi:MAG: SWIM zinc finger domain-containing protein [Desulfacinum sp.]|jgi:uncharacterized Zn finger protein|nr:SWIM zinc finger domain-containing protein [Desulfacinum sp.]
MESIKSAFRHLTLEDLREWAGSKIFNRGKGYIKRVSQLSRTDDGHLVAWVKGTDQYATWVRYEEGGNFEHGCTCPYNDWGPCKHAVAVVLATADLLKGGSNIPLLNPDEDLWLEAFGDAPFFGEIGTPEPWQKDAGGWIKAALGGKSREELIALLVELAESFPEVARLIRDRAHLETGRIDQVIRSLRKEIRVLSSQPAWYDTWRDEGDLPDYSQVERQLRTLLDQGYADAVLDLGEELWQRGMTQVRESHDDGHTAASIGSCLDIVVDAVPRSSLPPEEQLLWIVRHALEDDYALLGDVDQILYRHEYSPDHWRHVAESLENRLAGIKGKTAENLSYRGYNVLRWLLRAYQESGDTHKVIPLLEREAERFLCYEEIVAALIEAREYDRARRWCILGYQKTLEGAPGIAGRMKDALRKLARLEGRLDMEAAYRAEDFFQHRSEETYAALQQAAEKINVWPQVRNGVLHYLTTGRRPTASGGKGQDPWPLPEPEVQAPKEPTVVLQRRFPDWTTLILIALLEKRHDDAVALYQRLNKAPLWRYSIEEKLAEAVASTHPDISLRIWQEKAEKLIAQVKPKAYREAAIYLERMRTLYERTDRLPEWKALLLRLRTQHKAKRRLMEVLADLEGRSKTPLLK